MRRAAVYVLIGLAAFAAPQARADQDPYDTLRLYDGVWQVKADDGGNRQVHNHCTRNGMFYTCEQTEGDHTVALLVFVSTGPDMDGSQTYRTQAMGQPAEAPGGWNRLTVVGRRWIYEPEDAPPGQHALERTVTIFLDDDHIHYETQRSTDGGPWLRQSSGNEERVRR